MRTQISIVGNVMSNLIMWTVILNDFSQSETLGTPTLMYGDQQGTWKISNYTFHKFQNPIHNPKL